MVESALPSPPGEERFCSRCGDSLIPLDRPHLARQCNDCQKTKYVVEIGPDGGIRAREGDRLTIPGSWLRLSLDPASRGKLFRPGLKFLLSRLFYANRPKTAQELDKLLSGYVTTADEILESSELLKGLDLESEEDAKRAWAELEQKRDSREWYAGLLGTFSRLVDEAITENDARKAAWAMYQTATAHAMTVATEPAFEQALWRGYLANQVVYEAAVAATSTPAEAEALKRLQPHLERLGELTLHTWVHSGEPLGPKLGVKSLSERLLKALAEWQLIAFERRRTDAIRLQEDAKALRDLKVKWASVGVLASGAVWTILNGLGVL